MSSATFGQKRFIPTAPDKGSFPLDHHNVCKRHMIQYMSCLRENQDDNSLCRELSKEYLKCRMDNDLMAKEDWKSLGFTDTNSQSTQNQKQ